MVLLNTLDPFNIIMLLIAIILLIFLGKEIKRSVAPQVGLIIALVILIMHAIQLATTTGTDVASQAISRAMTVDFALVAISFFGYLWIDDIETKYRKKKSIDNSLDWFWKNV